MAKILSNQALSQGFYLIKVRERNQVHMGQFYMLRAWGQYPVLSRPISVFDADGETLSFLYRVVGEGTELLSKLDAIVQELVYLGLTPEDIGRRCADFGKGERE